MNKDDLKKEKQKLEDAYIQQEKMFTKLDEQTEMFHNWIQKTKESIFLIQSNWQSEDASNFILKVEDEITCLQNKNLKLAKENEEERRLQKRLYYNALDSIKQRINDEVKLKELEDDNL